MTGDIYAAGRIFQLQDLVLGVGTTQGTIKTDGTKYIGVYPTNGVESTRFYANGNVGFQNGGTYTDTGYRLQISASGAVSGALLVVGTSVITGSLSVQGSITGSLVGTASFASTSSFLNSATNAFIQNGNSFGTTALLGTNDNQSLALETSGSTRMFISSSGNVGINTATPETKLHIEDVTKTLTGNVAGVAQGSLSLVSTDAQAADKGASLVFGGNYINSSQTKIAFAGITGRKENSSSVNADGYLSFLTWRTTGLTEALRITSLGNVGIGTANPTKKLDVSGSDVLINGLTIGRGFGDVISNTAIGISALGANSGQYNTAIGNSALATNTSGIANTAVGAAALTGNIVGQYNTAIGESALANNNGNSNVAIGQTALYYSTGSNNIAVGSQAGFSITGENNIIIGTGLDRDPVRDTFTGSYTLSIGKDSANFAGLPHIWSPETVSISDSTTTAILAIDSNKYSGVFIEYVIEEVANGKLKSGTLKALFSDNGTTIQWIDSDSLSIGTAMNATFSVAVSTSPNVEVRLNNATGDVIYCSYTSRLILRHIT
jgi:hypothetical protein